MPLSPGHLVGHDDARGVFISTTLNGAEDGPCEISSSAMDDLAGGVSGGRAGREAQFITVRREIERIASAIFDDGSKLSSRMARETWRLADAVCGGPWRE